LIIAYFSKHSATHFLFPLDSPRLNYLVTDTISSKELIYNGRHSANKTQKPVELLQKLISNHVKPTDCILDLFSGTGSIAEAALRLGCFVISYEKDSAQIALTNIRLIKVAEELQTTKEDNATPEPEKKDDTQPESDDEGPEICASCGVPEREDNLFIDPCAICFDIIHQGCLPDNIQQPTGVILCLNQCRIKFIDKNKQQHQNQIAHKNIDEPSSQAV
jgi:16S rRNA G966 N2-methylase RsmD